MSSGILPFKNKYHLRKVAQDASKACFVCYKPTSTVLVSEDGRADFFYVCDLHLTDSGFATADIDPEIEAAKKRKEALDKEIDKLKKEWEQRKKSKKKEKKQDKDKDKDGEDDKEKINKESSLDSQLALQSDAKRDEEIINRKPRIYTLHKDIFNLRLGTFRAAQRAKQTRQMLQKPALFPTVPKHVPGQQGGTAGPSLGPEP